MRKCMPVDRNITKSLDQSYGAKRIPAGPLHSLDFATKSGYIAWGITRYRVLAARGWACPISMSSSWEAVPRDVLRRVIWSSRD